MRGKLFAVLLGLLTVFSTVLALGYVAKADEVPTVGLTGSEATITDRYGKVVTDTSTLSKWDDYNVKYQWSIQDGQAIAAGDTATVQLPDNAVAAVDLSFPLVDNNGQTVGTFSIKAGETTGTIVFNDLFGSVGTNRTGTIEFYVKGTTSSDVHYDWTVNKIGWIGSYDENGLPSKLTWNIAFNPANENVGNVVVKDTLGPNQTYVPGSVVARVGSYNDAGNFVQTGTVTPEVSVNGNELTFTFSNITSAVDMTYSSKLSNVSASNNKWNNAATMNGVTVTGNVNYGGSGTGNGTQELGSVVLTKQDATTGAKLSGAQYQLQGSDGEVIQSNLTTDANGEINICELTPGDYQFVETTAPAGYELNATPIKFTVNAQDVATPVSLTQKDVLTPTQPETGSAILTKQDATNGKALAGAVFDFKDAAGTVVQSGLTTDAAGQVTVDQLTPGEYSFVETSAPAGYELNQTPVPFTITAGQTAAVTVKATDEPETTEPEEPGTTEPEEPGTTEPENPGTTEPEQPGTTEPENPGTTEPEEPGTTEPENPGTTEPEQPGTIEPEQPGTTEPENPGTTEPENPEQPEKPTTQPGHSEQPGNSEQPGTPQPATPSQPSGNASATGTGQNGQAPAATLPQTDERTQQPDTLLGLGLAGIVLILGMAIEHRKF